MKFLPISTALAALLPYVVADFQVFFVMTGTIIGRRNELEVRQKSDNGFSFFFFNHAPDCADFDESKFGIGALDLVDAGDIGGLFCTETDNETCVPEERTDVQYLSWYDGTSPDNGYATQMTSCAIGSDTRITNNGDGTWNLVGTDGVVHGSCVKPANPQHVDCGVNAYYQGDVLFTCTSACTAMNDAN